MEFIVCHIVLQTKHLQAAKKKIAAMATSALVEREKLGDVG